MQRLKGSTHKVVFSLKTKLHLLLPVLFSMACSFPLRVWADTLGDVDALIQQARKENSEENYSDAENHYRQALSLSVRSVGGMSSVAGRSCRSLAEFLMNRGRYADAEHYMQRALVIASGYSGAAQDSEGEFQNTRQFVSDILQNPNRLAGSLEVAATLSSLADLRTREGKYNDAERMLRRCVQIYKSSGTGAGSPLNYSADSVQLLAEHQRSLAQVLYKEGNTMEAEEAFKTYVDTVRQAKGPSPELADALEHLSSFYRSQNRSSDADAADSEAKDLQSRFR
jgi:tetratricopeptide (TPR) repeat protein